MRVSAICRILFRSARCLSALEKAPPVVINWSDLKFRISLLEHGFYRPKKAEKKRIAKVLGGSVNELFRESYFKSD